MKSKSLLSIGIVPLALYSAANATELNIEAIEKYSQSQVTSVSQFSDVRPGDWAYGALADLVEKYGCVAGYPNGSFNGSASISRYEAASLLNACLSRVSESTEEVQKLVAEFQSELSALSNRVSAVESRASQLEASQFSTTTKLFGEATFVIGAVPDLETNGGTDVGNAAFNYDLRLTLDTSFSGKDLLRTRLRAGDFSADPFGSSSSLFKLDRVTDTANNIELDRLFYQTTFGNFNFTVGPKVRNTELAWIPTAYKAGVLDFFTTAGTPGAFNKADGAGFGVQYLNPNGFIAGVNYLSQFGNDSQVGLFNENGALNVMAQMGYVAPNWGAAVTYRYGTEGTRPRVYNGPTGANGTLAANQESNSIAVNAYWQPAESTWIPSISAGYGYNDVSEGSGAIEPTDSDSWYVGLQWSNVFAVGNSAGIAVGQAPTSEAAGIQDATIIEAFYNLKISDAISVTPALFYVENNQRYGNSDSWGGVIQTKFRF